MRSTGTAAITTTLALALASVACRGPEAPRIAEPTPTVHATAAPEAPTPVPAAPPLPGEAPASLPRQRPGGDVSQPRLIAHQNPPIPVRCYPLTVQGPEASFVFDVGVDAEGAVVGVRTVATPSFSPPCPEFDPVWHAAIRQWRYAPARRLGKPVAVTMRVSIDFK